MSRLHVLIIGPGLGRDDHMQSCAKIAFELAKDMEQMGVVVDADGLWLVQVGHALLRMTYMSGMLTVFQNEPKVVMDWPGVPRIILTPNVMEFKRLCDTMVGARTVLHLSPSTLINYQKINASGPHTSLCPQLATALGNATIIQKGPSDIISNGLKIPSALLSDESEEQNYLEVKVEGGLKRVGGQGDILSGSTGVLLAWGSEWVRGTYE